MGAGAGRMRDTDRVEPVTAADSFGPENMSLKEGPTIKSLGVLSADSTVTGGTGTWRGVTASCSSRSPSTRSEGQLGEPVGSTLSSQQALNTILQQDVLKTTPRGSLEARVLQLEDLATRQAAQLRQMQQTLSCVQRDGRRTVSVLQYNILASYLGRNTQPWFLYGADITPEERQMIFMKYNERTADGKPKNAWPKYVEDVLTPEQVAEIERHDAYFRWETRKDALMQEFRQYDADVVSLVELDHFSFFRDGLADEWDAVFHKRPRKASLDGCGVFWRRSKFQVIAHQGFDMVDDVDSNGLHKRDRSCLMVILRWRSCIGAAPLVVVSTHLAKDPDNRAQTAIRVRQVTQIMEGLMEFTQLHQAEDAPVILMGDLNARHFGEIRGIARTVWQVTGSQLHKFLWSATDVPTGPTSITKARQCRIDVVQYLSSHLEVLDVQPVPSLPPGQVIPSAKHPSDHFPVCVRFVVKESYQQHKEVARAWLECVAGTEKVHPLTKADLMVAFEYFNRDRSGRIHRHDLEEACLELRSHFHVDVQCLLLDCFPNQQISYENFIRAYESRLDYQRIRCIGELEYAFQFFANDESIIRLNTLESAFREITPISFSDDEVKEMIGRLNVEEGQEYVDLRSFCEVVCKANFPHRDRRKYKGDIITPRTGAWPCVESRKSSRITTQDLGRRLDELSQKLVGPGSFGASEGILGTLSDNDEEPVSPKSLRSPNSFDDAQPGQLLQDLEREHQVSRGAGMSRGAGRVPTIC